MGLAESSMAFSVTISATVIWLLAQDSFDCPREPGFGGTVKDAICLTHFCF